MKRIVYSLAHYLLVTAIPILLITTSLRVVINSERFYDYEFKKHNISVDTKISQEDLIRAARELVRYFNQPETPLSVQVRIAGTERELFNAKEKTHMEDVRNLVRGVYRWQLLSLAYVLMYSVGLLAIHRSGAFKELARGILKGALTTVGIFLAVGIGSLVGFDALFLQLHLLLYSNNLWMLDPQTDYLLKMFPDPFWIDFTFLNGIISALAAVVLGAITGIYLQLNRARKVIGTVGGTS